MFKTTVDHSIPLVAEKGLLQKDFNTIKEFFDRLDNDKNHFQNSNDICTPLGCVKQMVDTLPQSFWNKNDLKIFDSCCGNGNFHAYIAKKTNLTNLYFNEINERRIRNLKSIFGDQSNITQKDFLTFEDQAIYDLVVSNPPYAKFNGGLRVSKNHNLARAFIDKALSITKPGGYLLFIVPNNWMSFSDRNLLPQKLSQYQFIHLNIHGAKQWFPKVGSSFTWFLLQKVPNQKSFTVSNNYILKDTQKVKLNAGVRFVPLYCSNTTTRIINKTTCSSQPKYNIETTSYLHRYTKSDLLSTVQDTTFKHRLVHTPSQTVWSKVPHKYQKGFKVFISLTNQYSTFIDDCGMTQSVAFIRCNSLEEANCLKKELDSPVFKFLNNITRYGNFNNIRVLQSFNRLHTFKLNHQELALIEQFNSKYYGKKYQSQK